MRRNKVRLALCSLVAIAVAGCDSSSTGEPSGPIRTDNSANMADQDSASIPVTEAGQLPEAGPGARFVGKWAADEKSCETAAWQFTDSVLRTPAGSMCSFNRVNEVEGGYDISATCTAEGPPTSDSLKLRFEEGAKAVAFESETIADANLLFCGRDG